MGLQARRDVCMKAGRIMMDQLMNYSFRHSLCSVCLNQRDERQLALANSAKFVHQAEMHLDVTLRSPVQQTRLKKIRAILGQPP